MKYLIVILMIIVSSCTKYETTAKLMNQRRTVQRCCINGSNICCEQLNKFDSIYHDKILVR